MDEKIGITESGIIQRVAFCGCTNDALEAGRTCGQPQCPNAEPWPPAHLRSLAAKSKQQRDGA